MRNDNKDIPAPAQIVGAEDSQPQEISPGHAAYNIVSDTVTGVNVRGRDNLFQAAFIGVTMLLLAAVGAILAWLKSQWGLPWFAGALIGAFAGLVIGFFASGFFLMIYRFVRHVQGRHQ